MSLPPAASRCPTCGHSQGDAITIEVGAPRGGGRGTRRRDLLIVAGAIALVVGALVFAGHDAEPDTAEAATSTTTTTTTSPTTTHRTTTSIATTTTLPTLPPLQLGTTSGVRLLVSGGRNVTVIDLDTGSVVDTDMPSSSQMVARQGGVVVQSADGVLFYAEPFNLDAVRLGDGESTMFPSSEPDRVWVLDYHQVDPVVREVDTHGNVTAGPFSIPGGSVAGAVRDGVVGSVHGSIFVVDRSGAVRRLGYGDALGAGGDSVLASTCDVQLQCGVVVIDARTGHTTAVDIDPEEAAYQSVFSGDGATAAMYVYRNQSVRLEVVDIATGATTLMPQTLGDNGIASLWFSPDSRWLFFIAGGDVYAQRIGTDDLRQIETGPGPKDALTVV